MRLSIVARLKKNGWALLLFVVGVVATIWVTDVYGWLVGQFERSSPFKIDFQATRRCSGGELIDLRRHFADQSLKLEWGADRLIICDPDALQTNVADAPRDIANAFPGCLNYRTGVLQMLRSSDTVCALPSGDSYICDGEAAAIYPGSSALGAETNAIAPCTDQLLTQFGFDTTR